MSDVRNDNIILVILLPNLNVYLIRMNIFTKFVGTCILLIILETVCTRATSPHDVLDNWRPPFQLFGSSREDVDIVDIKVSLVSGSLS